MLAVLVHTNASTAQALFLVAAIVFALAFIIEAIANAGAGALLSTAAFVLVALGLVWL